jgi:hypothetical protein
MINQNEVRESTQNKLKDVDRDKLKFTRKLMTPRMISKIYGILCIDCKRKALAGNDQLCDVCVKKIEGVLNDKLNK